MAVDYERAGRIAKARVLADVLRLRGTTAAEAETYSPAERREVAIEARRREPSELTWEYVVADLRLRALLATVAPATDEEFAGL